MLRATVCRSAGSPRAPGADPARTIRARLRRAPIILLALAVCALVAGCGGPQINRDDTLRRLSDAIQAPVASPDEAQENSRLVETVVEEGLLEDMTREEVSSKIGRGDDCSRHPRCAEAGFEDDDWFYNVGQMGEGAAGAVPILIVGFDRFGKVTRTWNLRVH